MNAENPALIPGGLSDKHIVLTRPAGQSVFLAERLLEAGAHPVLYPVLEILPVKDVQPLLDAAIHLDSYDFAVFVSPNAVKGALAVIQSHRSWPAGLTALTIGKSSEQALLEHGVSKVLAPQQRFDSEALLELPQLADMAGKKVIVFRGDGGRELLGETLQARGASVDYVTSYHRQCPHLDPAPLLKRWNEHKLHALTFTSSEGLRHFAQHIGPLAQAFMRQTPTFVPHQRIADQALALGLHQVILTGPGDVGLLAGLQQYFAPDAATIHSDKVSFLP